MVGSNWRRAAVAIGVGVLATAMVVFMLQFPDLYPLWTVAMIGGVGALSYLSAFRTVTDD